MNEWLQVPIDFTIELYEEDGKIVDGDNNEVPHIKCLPNFVRQIPSERHNLFFLREVFTPNFWLGKYGTPSKRPPMNLHNHPKPEAEKTIRECEVNYLLTISCFSDGGFYEEDWGTSKDDYRYFNVAHVLPECYINQRWEKAFPFIHHDYFNNGVHGIRLNDDLGQKLFDHYENKIYEVSLGDH